MGYTHYWYRKQEISKDTMRAIIEDFSKIVLTLDSMGVKLADGFGKGTPEISEDRVWFNGLENCGHPANAEIVIPWPTDNAQGILDGRGELVGTWFAGAKLDTRCCNGDCSYETFGFPRVMPKESYFQSNERRKDLFFECCKTAYRPYDLAVTAFLVIAKHHLGADIRVSSDGELQHWIEGIGLCRVYLGYPETYQFSEDDGDLVPVAQAA